MSSQTVIDYLTKQIFIERNIVTYRLLSRDLRIHVNAAKNELATYHAVAPYQGQTCFATYVICGDQARKSQGDTEDFDMEAAMDDDMDYEYDEGEGVSQTTIMLVNERDFEDGRSKFTRIDSIHVYSLSPAHIHDAGLLCTPTESVRMTDGKLGSEIAPIVGKIVGANIQLQPTLTGNVPAAGPSRRKPPPDAASTSKPTVQAPLGESRSKADITKEKSKIVVDKAKDKPKPTGKLNFAKARAKEPKDEPEAKQDQKESLKAVSTSGSKIKESKSKDEPKKDEKSKEEVKRGTKRKSLKALISESEDDKSSIPRSKSPSESHSKGSVRVNGRMVLSDDSDDDSSPHPRMLRMSLRGPKTVDSEAERDLKGLMDIDDDEVIRVTREKPALMKEEEEESSEDAEALRVDDSVAPKPKPKKRREKKIVPMGRNGLKKKRVVKSRMTTDAKGYMVTEDYSSYESVDEEEEPEPAAPAKGKAKAKSSSKAKEEEASSTPPAPKIRPVKRASLGPDAQSGGVKAAKSRTGTSKNGSQKQKPLMNFFAPQTKAKS